MNARALLLAAALLALPGAGRAQDDKAPNALPPGVETPLGRVFGQAGVTLAFAAPRGAFADYVDAGYGANLSFGARLARAEDGIASIRGDLSFVMYGNETRRAPLSPTVPLVTVEYTTSNMIIGLVAGPEIAAARGVLRPYFNAAAGFSYFVTSTSVRGEGDIESFASSTNFDDITWSLRGGGGLRVQLSSGRTPVALDFSAHYLRNGRAQYLREGSITIDPFSNTPIYSPIESETDFWLFHAGVSLGLRTRRH